MDQKHVTEQLHNFSTSINKKLQKTPSLLKKQLNDIIASPLVELVNKLFQSDIFPDIFEIAKVI